MWFKEAWLLLRPFCPLTSAIIFCGREDIVRIAYNNFMFLHRSRGRALRLVRWVTRDLWSVGLCAVHAASAVALVGFRVMWCVRRWGCREMTAVILGCSGSNRLTTEESAGIVSCWLSFPCLQCLGSEIFPIRDIFGFWNICVDSPIWKFNFKFCKDRFQSILDLGSISM